MPSRHGIPLQGRLRDPRLLLHGRRCQRNPNRFVALLNYVRGTTRTKLIMLFMLSVHLHGYFPSFDILPALPHNTFLVSSNLKDITNGKIIGLMCFLLSDFLTDKLTLEYVQLRFCRFKSITGECVAANISNFAFQGDFPKGHWHLSFQNLETAHHISNDQMPLKFTY